jgi:hypothetical protein
MRKLIVFPAVVLCLMLSTKSFSQDRLPGSNNNSSSESSVNISNEFKADLDEVSVYVANRMVKCCSSFGGNNIYGKVKYDEVRKSSLDGSFSIPMTVGWYGSLTGTHYWIKGILKVDKDGNKKWLKQSDSGGPFKEEGCGINCSL